LRPAADSALRRRARGLALGLRDAPSVAVPFHREDLGVVDEAIDERGGGGGVGKDGRPVAEGQVGRYHETAFFIPAADDLKEEIGSAGVVGEIADLIDLLYVELHITRLMVSAP